MIYLDNASTTKIDKQVLDAMMPYLKDEYGNAGTLHSTGVSASRAIEAARVKVAKLINATPEQIVFTSGGSEANNMVFAGLRKRLVYNQKNKIVSTLIEHDSVIKAVRALCDDEYRDGFRFRASFVTPKVGGVICPVDISKEIDDSTGIVSVMYANNETGIRNPVCEIGKICTENGVMFHTDAVQALGCCNIDVRKIGCDFLSLSGHKIHAPKGVGALYIKDKETFSPMICGGNSQEFGLRGGTENVAGIVGLGVACDLLKENMNAIIAHINTLTEYLCKQIQAGLAYYSLDGIFHQNIPRENNDSYGNKVLNVRFDNVDSETLLIALDAQDICISAGSACTSHEQTPSRVLLACGISEEDARNSIRISLSRMNTVQEMDDAAKDIVHTVLALYDINKTD